MDGRVPSVRDSSANLEKAHLVIFSVDFGSVVQQQSNQRWVVLFTRFMKSSSAMDRFAIDNGLVPLRL